MTRVTLFHKSDGPTGHNRHRAWALPCVIALTIATLLVTAAARAESTVPAPTVLITGSNRGIGLEFARQYAALGWRVIATTRNPEDAAELKAIKARFPSLVIERMDITDQAQVDALAARYRGQPIDVLLNNAAFLDELQKQTLEGLDFDLFERTLAVNTLGPMRVSRAFLPNVLASQQKTIVTLSSIASSHGDLRVASPLYAYRASKAALNMLMHVLALDVAKRGVRVALLNPGLVDTRGIMALKAGDPVPEAFQALMPAIRSGQLVLITPEESVRGMLQRIRELTPAQSGTFIDYDGKVLPW